jgi:CBS domain-containing protein
MAARRTASHEKPEASMQSTLMNKARKPPVSVPRDLPVIAAVRLMAEQHVGAALILENDRPVGIFTERDLMIKVVLEGRDPRLTRVAEVMTSPVVSVREHAKLDEAVRLMLRRHIRHLPLVDVVGRVQGMLSMRHLVIDEIDELQHSVNGLQAYLGYDGPGA